MSASARRRLYMSFDFVPQAVSAIAVAMGALVLIGWVFNLDTLKSVLPGLTIMKANTAAGFILSGVALWEIETGAQSRPLRIGTQVCACIVLLLGLLTLTEYLSGADLGIDQILIREITHLPGDIPGRMAVNTALSFAALGAALLLLSLGQGSLVVAIHALAVVPIILGGSAVIGYGYEIEEFLRAKLNYTPMSLHAATVFVLLAFGVVNARADYPFRRFATSSNPAGVMVRRLLPAAIVFTVVTGGLILEGYEGGYFSEIFSLALFTAVSIAGLAAMTLWNAGTLYEASVRREQVEESLRAASLYARSLIEASLDPLVTISTEGKITDVNEATVKATGVTRETLIGSDFSNYFTEPDKARAGYQEVFAKGFATDYPLALRHASGSVMEVLYNASVYRNAKGEIAGVFAAARDIAERKRAEWEVNERVKELQAFYNLSELAERKDIAPDRLYQELANVLPKSWQYPEIACARIVAGNSEFRTDNFGVSEWMQAAPVKVYGSVIGKVEVGYLERKPEQDEGPFLKEERRLLNAIAERVGHITESRQAEEALRASEERFRALANATSEGMLIHEHGRIVEANRHMEEILARPRAEIVGAAVLDLVAPAWRGKISGRVEKAKDERVEFAFLRPDGSETIVSSLAHPCVYRGRPMRVAVYRDITLEKRAEEALRNVGTYNRSLIEVSLDPLVTISPEGKITDVNEATAQATGMPRSLLIGSDFSDYFTEPDKARAGYQEVFAKGFVTDYPLSLRHISGRTRDVLYNASVYRNVKGEVAGVFAAARDVTERKRAEEQLRAASLYARSLIEASLDPLVTISVEGKITDVNEATVRATGVPRKTLIGSDFLVYFAEPEKARAGYQEVFAKGFVTDYPLTMRHVSGKVIEVLYNASVYRDVKGEVAGVFAAARDISERRKLERELEQQAHKDVLTGLNTRRFFFELAEQELARSRRHGEPLSLLMMDLDHFKSVNDTYGHHIGDAALQKLSEMCLHTFREIDLIGRLGGEEFVALLPETSIERAMEVAERLRQAVENAAVKLEDGSLIHFTVSIGVTGIKATDAKVETALKRADTALYKAKSTGRNRVCSNGATGTN